MSWSLLLSTRLSPAVLLGVSRNPGEASGAWRDSRAAVSGHRILVAPRDFPMQLSTAVGTQLAYGARTQAEEQPITAV